MARPPAIASERLQRILAIAPWIAGRDGPTVSEICDRFDIGAGELAKDLEVLTMVGVPPYSPDTLVDVTTDDDRVWVNLGPYFRRPMRLTSVEALTLVTAARIVGTDDPVLAGAVQRILDVIGDGTATEVVGADVGDIPEGAVSTIRAGIQEHRRIRLDYYGYASDQRTVRDVDPFRLQMTDGHWYLTGYCHRAEAERLFRVDRIHSVELLPETFDAPDSATPVDFFAGTAAATIVLDLDAASLRSVDQMPTTSIRPLPDGGAEVEFPIGGPAWLERTLLRFGTRAVIRGGTRDGEPVPAEELVDLRRAAALRVRARYGPPADG